MRYLWLLPVLLLTGCYYPYGYPYGYGYSYGYPYSSGYSGYGNPAYTQGYGHPPPGYYSPSTLSRSHCGVQPLQLNAGVGGGELPIGLCVVLVAASLPGGDFLDQGLLVRDAPIKTLR
jgi:hypothetical protein